MGAGTGRSEMRALVLANVRFWGSVAPVAQRELARWREHAARIDDEGLREMALAKLVDESFNAEVAATLATLAPRARRAGVVKAIVALEVLFDYMDGRTEALFDAGAADRGQEALQQGRVLSASLAAVIDGQARPAGADSEYVESLWRHAHDQALALPRIGAVTPAALAAASRCGEAQLRLHAARALGDGQLQGWAQEACEGSGLGWREYVGGCASSVLAMHALIAAAARPETSEAEAQALDETYLTIGAVITTLDSLVDDARDTDAGEPGYIRLYEDRDEIAERLDALIRLALARAGALRDGAHHAMTLAGVAAYYTTHPGAAEEKNRAVCAAVRGQLAPTIWPTLAVLRTWRGAKRVRGALAAGTRRRRGDPRAPNRRSA